MIFYASSWIINPLRKVRVSTDKENELVVISRERMGEGEI